MASTFGPGLASDPSNNSPVPNAIIRVVSADGLVPLTPIDESGQPINIFTNRHGQFTQFRVAEDVPLAILTCLPYQQLWPSVEATRDAIQKAQSAADRAEAAADRVGAPLITTTDPGFEGAVGDAEGRPSWLRYDRQGLPTSYVADALETVGVPHAEDAGDGLTIAGEDGTPTWLSATGEGGPDSTALTWLANTLHVHVGPDEPEVYPGGWIVWTRTDATGTPIETLIGRN